MDDETILDTCGTGDIGTPAFNVSTAIAFVIYLEIVLEKGFFGPWELFLEAIVLWW